MVSDESQQSARLFLILGGARSGKSTFAERLAAQSQRSVAFIATATAGDNDMRDRIERHQRARPAHWITIEEPLQPGNVLRRAAREADVLLLDCMTLWLSNWMTMQSDPHLVEASAISSQYCDRALEVVDDILAQWSECGQGKTLLVISNEVGLGIVPSYALGRIYRDTLGRVNQRLAAHAERVYLMVAGLAVDIKRLHEDATL